MNHRWTTTAHGTIRRCVHCSTRCRRVTDYPRNSSLMLYSRADVFRGRWMMLRPKCKRGAS